MRKSAWPARRMASPTGNAIEPTPSFGLARTNGTTTLFTNHMRSSMASNGCSGTTVARVASSRSGWRCIRGRTWASEAGDCGCRDGGKGNHATHDNQDREARRHQFHPGQTHFVKSVEDIHEALVAA